MCCDLHTISHIHIYFTNKTYRSALNIVPTYIHLRFTTIIGIGPIVLLRYAGNLVYKVLAHIQTSVLKIYHIGPDLDIGPIYKHVRYSLIMSIGPEDGVWNYTVGPTRLQPLCTCFKFVTTVHFSSCKKKINFMYYTNLLYHNKE